ncbi:MAG: ABC transporter permease [Chloroflexi bacterium]|nr:ABC transporter permease [Chloroflexota bacterium]
MANANSPLKSASGPAAQADWQVVVRRRLRAIARFIRQLFAQPSAAIGTLIVIFFLILALFGSAIAPYGENDQSHPTAVAPGTADYPLGTDFLGRDILSRVILGTSSIFVNAGLGTLVAVGIGTAVGLLIGYQGGWLDEVVSRLIDAFLALPALLIALVALGVVRGAVIDPTPTQRFLLDNSVLLVIAAVYAPIVARVVRGSTLEIKTLEFVQAARIRGETVPYILFREIFPSVVPALVVEASLRFSYAIFLVAALGFLGVGARPPTPDWGLMVSESSGGRFQLAPWALTYPAIAISLLVIGVNLMSDGIKNIVQKSE